MTKPLRTATIVIKARQDVAMRVYWKHCIGLCALIVSTLTHSGQYGTTLSLPLAAKEPNPTRGFQWMLDYDPLWQDWHRFTLYFDGGVTHFTTDTTNYATINIFSLAPVVRYTPENHRFIAPYLEASIGLAYLSKTHFDHRNLGIHMAFQDRLGMGALFGSHQQYSLGIHLVHYSNAHLSSHNSGITVPILLDLGYHFQ